MNLYPFQKEAIEKSVKFLKERNAIFNASEMGTGKSVVAIKTIIELSGAKPTNILIVCPAIVCLVWEKEICIWDPQRQKRRYYIISYDKAAKDKYNADLAKMNWDFLIGDEIHFCKNLAAKRTKAFTQKLWPKAKKVICQSGTPMTQSVVDMFPVLSRMIPDHFQDYWAFVKNYTNLIRIPWGMGFKFEGVKNHERLKKILKANGFFRYTKEQVLKELPDKIYQSIPLGEEYRVKENESDNQAYLALFRQAMASNLPPPKPPIPIATALREQGLKKVKPVSQFCKDLLDTNTPIVLFYYHKDVGFQLEKELKEYSPVRIGGDTSEEERKKAVSDFQEGRTNCFIGQISASGIGITLTRSSRVIFAELSFSPAHISQCIDRTHRIGQSQTVNVYYFSVLNSLDEKIQEVLLRKSTDFKKVLAA